MEAPLLSSDILTRVFSHLATRELFRGPVFVCKKWRDAVLTNNHRNLPPDVAALLRDVTPPVASPLQLHAVLYEQNLLRDQHFRSAYFRQGNPEWMLSKAGLSFSSASRANVTPARFDEWSALSSNYFGLVPVSQDFKSEVAQVTQVVILDSASLLGCDAAPDGPVERFLDSSQLLRFTINLTEICTEDEGQRWGADPRLVVTIALDDGTPVVAPYQNSTMSAYTREALHVHEIELRHQGNGISSAATVVKGYPRGIRRAIVSLTFYDTIRERVLSVSKPRLCFSTSI